MCQRGMSVQELPDLIIFTDTINIYIDVVYIFLIIFSKNPLFFIECIEKEFRYFE